MKRYGCSIQRLQQRNYDKERNRKRRLIVLTHYGGANPKCQCCSESTYEFLSIDHELGGGCAQRRDSGFKGSRSYADIIKQGFPKGLRILCHNCNLALGFYGKCPHESRHELQFILTNFESFRKGELCVLTLEQK